MMGRMEFRLNVDNLPPLLDEDTRTQLIEKFFAFVYFLLKNIK